jgi:hypothetical protein
MSKKDEDVVVTGTDVAMVEEKTNTLVTTNDFAADDDDNGFEGTDENDYTIPFLQILQALSAQCSDGDPKFDEKFRPGMFVNSVTEEYYSGKTGLLFVPCLYRRAGTLWTPRDEGGGFRGSVDAVELEALLANCTQDEKYNQVTPDGLHLVDTREWYGLVITEDGTKCDRVLLSLCKTQLKKSKRWLTLAQGLRANDKPLKLWSQVYRLTTAPEKNDKGSWAGLQVDHVGNVPSMKVFAEAAAFRELIRSGAVKVAHPEGESTEKVPF